MTGNNRLWLVDLKPFGTPADWPACAVAVVPDVYFHQQIRLVNLAVMGKKSSDDTENTKNSKSPLSAHFFHELCNEFIKLLLIHFPFFF